MENRGILVYCIAEKSGGGLSAIDGLSEGGKLYAISDGGLSAVVSDVDLNEYGEEAMAEKGEDIAWLREKASVFMDIILKVMGSSDIIPMKFLTIFLSEDRVREMLEENRDRFTDTFRKITGREELSVKLYCDSKKYKEATLSEEIGRFEKSLVGKPKGAAFFLKKKFESELDDKMQAKICSAANRVAEALKEMAVDWKPNKILAKEITQVETPMVLNCAFLIEEDQRECFQSQAEKLSADLSGSGFLFEISGPWPPYSFC